MTWTVMNFMASYLKTPFVKTTMREFNSCLNCKDSRHSNNVKKEMKPVINLFDRRYGEMEAKLRKKHDEERQYLQREKERQAKFADEAYQCWDAFLFGDRRRLIGEIREARNEASILWEKIFTGDARCVC